MLKFIFLLAISFSVLLINGKTLRKDFNHLTDIVKICSGNNCDELQYLLDETEIGNKNKNKVRTKRAKEEEKDDKSRNAGKKRSHEDDDPESESELGTV